MPMSDHPRRILVCRIDNLGDVVMVFPALRWLKSQYPALRKACWTTVAVPRPWARKVRMCGARSGHEFVEDRCGAKQIVALRILELGMPLHTK